MWLTRWLLRRAAKRDTLPRPMTHDELVRAAFTHAREQLRRNIALFLHGPLSDGEKLRRIAASIGEPLDELPDEGRAGVSPVRVSTPPPWLIDLQGSNESFRERNRAYAEQIKTRHELPALPGDLWQKYRRLHGKPGQP